jgi:hypothetical protein
VAAGPDALWATALTVPDDASGLAFLELTRRGADAVDETTITLSAGEQNDERQKRLELAQFERFAAACASVPAGAPRQPDQPEPDIVPDGPRGGITITDVQPSGE